MSDHTSSIEIIILNRNNAPDTLACLASLAKSNYPARLVVVDNGSDDGSPQAIAEACPHVEVLASGGNRGFAGGMNFGIAHALAMKAEYILSLNNDTIVAPDAIDELMRAAAQQPAAGMWIPKIYFYSKPDVIWSAGAEQRRFPPRVKMRGLGRPDGPDFDRPAALDYATGCAMLIRREVFDQAGLFDEGFFMYQEDYDFCYRVRRAGWGITYVPAAKIWHKVSVSLGGDSPRWWYHWSRSMVRLYRHTWGYSWVAFAPILCWMVGREVVKGRLRFARPLAAGVRDEMRALKTIGAESRVRYRI